MFKKCFDDTSGNIGLVFALALVPMMGAAGVAVDYSSASSERSSIQSALDAAVLGAVHKPNAERFAAAKAIFESNMPSGKTVDSLVFTNEADGILRGTVTQAYQTRMAKIIGAKTLNIGATAAAQKGVAAPSPPPPAPPGDISGVCVLVLDPFGSQALLVNSGARVGAPKCEVHVKSKASPAAIFNSGASLKTKKFCIEGANVIQNSIVVENLALNCKTASDPFAGNLPAPASTSCTVTGTNYSGKTTLNPGVYCGWFNFNGVTDVTFNPGVYVIKDGGWNVSGGSFIGKDVTFYFADTSKIQFNSGMDTDLEPPKSGTYKGILFYEAMGLPKSDFIFNNAIKNRMEGLIYLPSRNVTFNADSKMGNDKATIVVHRMIWNNVSMNVQPFPDRGIITEGTPGAEPVAATPVASATPPKLVH
ncbi:MAG: pilus assembly protein TadG-related protein [Beijerinckiaceae bacterium]